MRVIAGLAKGHRLVTPYGCDTRPTADRIKQSLFNIIDNDLRGCNFLDLFSGTGAIGIEALSRGASMCSFVDSDKSAIDCIIKNIEHTKFVDKAYTYFTDVENALNIFAKKSETYNIIFMDPPYEMARHMEQYTAIIKQLGLLAKDGYIVGEHGVQTDVPAFKGVKVLKEKRYGKTTIISFWEPNIW